MKILIESGATKSDWRVFNSEGKQTDRFKCQGMNVSSMKIADIEDIIKDAVESHGFSSLDELIIYTAGVVTDGIREELSRFIKSICDVRIIDIQNDLTGAARALFGKSSGIVAIMGTGSNVCFYDGNSLSQKVYAGGFILGDDGSAAVLGKLFLADFLKGLVPENIASAFSAEFDSSYSGIVENVYRNQAPSKYLGSLAPFIVSHYSEPYIKNLVDGNFKAFIKKSILRYDTDSYPLGVVGGFGYAYRDIFTRLCLEAGIKVSKFLPEPIDGLIEYHITGR